MFSARNSILCCMLKEIICKDGEDPVTTDNDLNENSIKTHEETYNDDDDENVICSCPICCCVCSCIKSISK